MIIFLIGDAELSFTDMDDSTELMEKSAVLRVRRRRLF